jgi:hypothetical protein
MTTKLITGRKGLIRMISVDYKKIKNLLGNLK